ncbi:MAG: hypothetical protein LBT59_03675, partial [Clostridiales bacterium]|nr:hypothetical protein [Clostridiales bacterium]
IQIALGAFEMYNVFGAYPKGSEKSAQDFPRSFGLCPKPPPQSAAVRPNTPFGGGAKKGSYE